MERAELELGQASSLSEDAKIGRHGAILLGWLS